LRLFTNGNGKRLSNDMLPAHAFPYTEEFLEAPHNGQVKLQMNVHANDDFLHSGRDNVDIRRTRINPAYTDEMSADAGTYSCTMIMTLAAL
jgi:hypothetical protein